jgi:hypothetical protein
LQGLLALEPDASGLRKDALVALKGDWEITKGLTAKMVHAVAAGTMFYLMLNKIGKAFDCNISDDLE